MSLYSDQEQGKHFLIVAGEEVDRYLNVLREEQVKAVPGGMWESESLVAWQRRIHHEGFRSAELVKSIHGWTLRHGSGLDGFGIIERTNSFDYSYAVRVAKRWQAADPNRRYVFVRRYYLEAN